MKYKDEQGNWKEVSVKAADTLPVGTIVDYDGDTVPDGYEKVDEIIESGNNSNGTYTKFSDGTMICTKKMSITTTIDVAWGSFYESPKVSLGDYAASFIEVPCITISSRGTTAFFEAISDSTTSSFGNTYLSRPTKNASTTYGINLVAIGRWK